MEPRIDIGKAAPGVQQAMFALSKYLRQSGLDENLVNLICLRASQINGCAFCIDMHWKDLKAAGEQDQRLYGLDAWEESPYYSDREPRRSGLDRSCDQHPPRARPRRDLRPSPAHLLRKRTGRSYFGRRHHQRVESPEYRREDRPRNVPARQSCQARRVAEPGVRLRRARGLHRKASLHGYSYRRAVMGSTRIARRAGA